MKSVALYGIIVTSIIMIIWRFYDNKKGCDRMKNYTHEINEIIVNNGLKKWQLAQHLSIVPTYLSAQLRDGIKTDKARKAYYNALADMLAERKRSIEKAESLIAKSTAELDKELAEQGA